MTRLGSTACVLAILAALALPTSATAQVGQDEIDYARKGAYFGIGGIVAFDNFDLDALEAAIEDQVGDDVSLDDEKSLGIAVRGGYRFHPRVSAELEFDWLDSFEIEAKDTAGASTKVDLETWLITANAKAYLMTGAFQPFALVGVGGGRMNVTNFGSELGGAAARFGGGMDYYATERLVLSLDVSYVIMTGDLSDFDFTSINWGLLYRL